jgi:hypothetical protein
MDHQKSMTPVQLRGCAAVMDHQISVSLEVPQRAVKIARAVVKSTDYQFSGKLALLLDLAAATELSGKLDFAAAAELTDYQFSGSLAVLLDLAAATELSGKLLLPVDFAAAAKLALRLDLAARMPLRARR